MLSWLTTASSVNTLLTIPPNECFFLYDMKNRSTNKKNHYTHIICVWSFIFPFHACNRWKWRIIFLLTLMWCTIQQIGWLLLCYWIIRHGSRFDWNILFLLTAIQSCIFIYFWNITSSVISFTVSIFTLYFVVFMVPINFNSKMTL